MMETRAGIPSPCVRNCCLNEKDVCLGCFRSLKEICDWSQADDRTRLDILQNAEQRRKAAALQRSSESLR